MPCRALTRVLQIHAGESYGPESIKQAFVDCDAERIGHGYNLFNPHAGTHAEPLCIPHAALCPLTPPNRVPLPQWHRTVASRTLKHTLQFCKIMLHSGASPWRCSALCDEPLPCLDSVTYPKCNLVTNHPPGLPEEQPRHHAVVARQAGNAHPWPGDLLRSCLASPSGSAAAAEPKCIVV